MLDSRTFGGSRAAEVLVERLKSYDSKMTGRVGRFWVSYTQTMNELKKLNSRTSISLAKLILHNSIIKAETFPEDIKTYLRNIINARYKIFLSEMNGLTPYKKRVDNPNKKG